MVKRYNQWTEEEKNSFIKQQEKDFEIMKKMLSLYFDIQDESYWKAVAAEMLNVVKNCDRINYQSRYTADAYAIWHLLDRYRRFQLMQKFLLENNYGIHLTVRPIRIMDVGTGPAPALLAFSDFYKELNSILENNAYSCKEDYIEKSEGFREFLHRFCEIAFCEGHKFEVPYHHGSFYDIKEFSGALDIVSFGGIHRKKRFHPDMVIFSNFLTNEGIVEKYKVQLNEISKSMKNYGLIIVVSSKQSDKKYKKAFEEYNHLFLRKTVNWKYIVRWQRKKKDFVYNYCDSAGEIMRSFYAEIKKHFIENNAWQDIDLYTQQQFQERIDNDEKKIKEDGWKGNKWEMNIYQKRVRLTDTFLRRRESVSKVKKKQ